MAIPTRRVVTLLLVMGIAYLASFTPAGAARKHASSRPAPCSFGSPPSGLPAVLTGAPDPAITAAFAVLRRPAGPADLLPPINPVGQQLSFELRSYYGSYIRQLVQDRDGQRYFLIPGFQQVFLPPPTKCLPKSLRRQRARLIAQQRKLASEPVYCIAAIGPHSPPYVGAACQPFAAIRTGEDLATSALSTSEVDDLAPDGVASVRLTYRSGRVINARVSDNFFSFTPPQRPIKRAMADLQHAYRGVGRRGLSSRQRARLQRAIARRTRTIFAHLAPSVQWLDAGNHVIRSFTPRLPGPNGLFFGA